MQQNSNNFDEMNVQYCVGDAVIMSQLVDAPSKIPFDESIINFLALVSKKLLSMNEAKEFPDVITLGFWMRKASIESLKRRFEVSDESAVKRGRGVVFHIAPSNVPVNYAYSLVTGLLCGNKNVIRIPSKDFNQVTIINRVINDALTEMPEIKPYICLIKYGHDAAVNDKLSEIADVRVIWGGDNTINEIRNSKMKPRATEITFADRYSLAVIDSNAYLKAENKDKIAQNFYNDTYLTDQNACTSPRAVVWTGDKITEAKEQFWDMLHKILIKKYSISGVQSVNKLTSGYILAAMKPGVKKITSGDNLIIRMQVPSLTSDLMEIKDNSGYFFEYDCKDIYEIREFCNDTRCQTLAYIGSKEQIKPLIMSDILGIDRVVPIGETMNFDFMWDGYNLFERMTRNIVIK
jgi:Acyl-CoA reductase (LuxC).